MAADPGPTLMTRTVFAVPKMDCPSEEQMIRTALDGVAGIRGIACDLAARTVRVVHDGEPSLIEARLAPLGLGAVVVESTRALDNAIPTELDPVRERRTLKILLAINATMFIVGLVAGILAGSTGLLSDSLDMFADATVFALSLYAVGRGKGTQLRAAHVSGWLQAMLAIAALAEVVRRFARSSWRTTSWRTSA